TDFHPQGRIANRQKRLSVWTEHHLPHGAGVGRGTADLPACGPVPEHGLPPTLAPAGEDGPPIGAEGGIHKDLAASQPPSPLRPGYVPDPQFVAVGRPQPPAGGTELAPVDPTHATADQAAGRAPGGRVKQHAMAGIAVQVNCPAVWA